MSEYASWGKFYDCDKITHEMLNAEYGEHGMFFKTYSEAEVHKFKRGGQIYPIRNYHHSAFSYGNELRKDAKPYIEGYYVSHPVEAKANDKVYQFRGK